MLARKGRRVVGRAGVVFRAFVLVLGFVLGAAIFVSCKGMENAGEAGGGSWRSWWWELEELVEGVGVRGGG